MSFRIREGWGDVERVVRNKYADKLPTPVVCGEDSKVQQHFKDSCDINKIARDPNATGKADPAVFRDLSDIMDFGLNMDKQAKAQQLFDQAPVELRKRVGHSIPGLFAFIGDHANFDECVKYGIFEKPKAAPLPPAGPSPQSRKDGSLRKAKVLDESPDTE